MSKDTIIDRQSVEKFCFKNGLTHSNKKQNNFLCTNISVYLLKNEKKSLAFLEKNTYRMCCVNKIYKIAHPGNLVESSRDASKEFFLVMFSN